MEEAFYTHARWRVKPGREEEFIEAWRKMASAFAALPDAIGHGTLIRSVDDPSIYYSFGPWRSLDAIHSMRGGSHTQEALIRVRDLCDEFTTGTYEVVAEVYP